MDPAPGEGDKINSLKSAMYSRETSDKLGARPRRMLHDIAPKIGEDWVKPEQPLSKTLVASSALIAAPRVAFKVLLGVAAFFFVAALGFFVYFFFFGSGSSSASAQNVSIHVSGPTQISGGSPVELQVIVTNRNPMPLLAADLVITYPPGTRSTADLQTSLPVQRIALGAIEAGGTRQGTVSAAFSGTEGERADVHIELEYRLQNSNAIFVAASDYSLLFASSPISVSVDADSETVSGQETSIVATVSSNSQTLVRDAVLAVQFPFGFTVKTTDPQPASDGFWTVGDLRPGESKKVTIRGVLQGEASDERVFHITAGLRNTSASQKVDVPLAGYDQHMTVAQAFLGLAVSINKETGESAAVAAPGDTVNVSVLWQNNLAVPITNAVIIADLSGLDIDGSTVRSDLGFYRSTDGTVYFDRNTTNGQLARLSPGTKGTLNFSFQVPLTVDLTRARNPKLDIAVNATGERVGQNSVPESLRSAAIRSVRVGSDVMVEADGVYYSNPWGSTGPLPPKVGQETTYAIVFTIRNTTNKIKDAELVATLPPYVRWLGKYAGSADEALIFSNATSSVTWRIGDIDAGTGAASTTPRRVAFEIGFTPSASQTGSQPSLLNNITLDGIDTWTGVSIKDMGYHLRNKIGGYDLIHGDSRVPDITTNLTGSDPGFTPQKGNVTK